MISLVNAKEVISTSRKETILLVISQKDVGLGKGTSFQSELIPEGSDAEPPRHEAIQTRSYQNRESTQFFGEFIPKQD